MKRYFIVCLLSIAAAWAQAGVGLTEVPGVQGDGPVTVFYPSTAANQGVQRAFFRQKLLP